jgi:hypothetical protein
MSPAAASDELFTCPFSAAAGLMPKPHGINEIEHDAYKWWLRTDKANRGR